MKIDVDYLINILSVTLSDGNPGQWNRQSVHCRPGTAPQNLYRLLADGVGAAFFSGCHVNHKGGERSGQMSPVLARNV